jgi:hypothetical protein
MEAYLRGAGFEVLRRDFAADHLHVSYVCRAGREAGREVGREVGRDTVPSLPEPAQVERMLREIRFVQNAPRQ